MSAPDDPRSRLRTRHVPISRVPGVVFPAITDPNTERLMALQFQLEQSQWWSPEDLRKQQLLQLSRILAHAEGTTPYYRNLFAQHGLKMPAEVSWDFFTRLPISRRNDLQQAGDAIISTLPPKEHGPVQFKTTSGSTGRPLRFAGTAVNGLVWRAFALREHLWHQRDFSKKHGAIRFAKPGVAEDEQGLRSPNWGPSVDPIFPSGPATMLNVSREPSLQLAWLQREQPDYLITFPSNLLALMTASRASGIPLPKLCEIRTVGETLHAEDRRRIETAWGAKITDLYSCEEAGFLAAECREHGRYHVQSENIILEIVDDAGQPCPPGTPGRVVITSLLNFASPLIRLDLGDVAEFGEPCPCGRGLPVLRRIHGRIRNRIVLPDGTTRYPRIGEEAIIAAAPDIVVRQFKGIQHSLVKFELLIAANRELTGEEQSKLADEMRVYLGHPFEITFTFVDEIPAGPTGKRENFECRLGL